MMNCIAFFFQSLVIYLCNDIFVTLFLTAIKELGKENSGGVEDPGEGFTR